MTREDIIRQMSDAGLKAPAKGDFIFIHWDQIALLLSHEREACAKVVDAIEARCIAEDIDDKSLAHVAAAVRARNET